MLGVAQRQRNDQRQPSPLCCAGMCLCWDVLGRLAATTAGAKEAALRRHGWTGTEFELRVCAFEQMRFYLAVKQPGSVWHRMDASFSRDPHE